MEEDFNMGKIMHVHTLEDLKTLSTGELLFLRDGLSEEKLKTKKAYRMCTVNIVLGSGLVALGLVTGIIPSSFLGGMVLGKGVINSTATESRLKTFDEIIGAINDEVAYREFGKEVFPEFFQEKKTTIFDLMYPREM